MHRKVKMISPALRARLLCRATNLILFQPQPGHEKTSEIFRSVKSSEGDDGIHHLGHDRVLRSFDSTGAVVDYRRLSPDEIAAILKTLSTMLPPGEYEKLTGVMDGVDRRDVIDMEQILHPGPELRPLPTPPPEGDLAEDMEKGNPAVGGKQAVAGVTICTWD